MERSICEVEAARGEHLVVRNKQARFQRWLFSLSTWWWLSFSLPSHFFSILSCSRYLDVPTYDSLLLIIMMSRWDLELCPVSWKRWYCDTSVGSKISGFTILPSHALPESNRNNSPAHLVVDCKALMDWQFESQLLSWCSFNYKAW